MEELIKEELRPTKEELESLASFARELSLHLSKFGEVKLMGSYAKGTLLRGKREVDIFVLVEKGTDLHNLVNSMRAALGSYDISLAFASHPYIKVRKGDLRADVVPSYKVSSPEEMESAVDRTQLHVEYVNAHLKEEQKDEVRLLKQFFSNLGTYGAEIRVKGFSGYLCELFVIKFGTFKNVLKALAHFDGKPFSLEGEASHDFDDPLVFIDPVDPNRNVASPVSEKSLAKAVMAANSYLKFPGREFFFFDGAEEFPFHVVAVEFPESPAVDDLKFGILRKLASKMASHLSRKGFEVIDHYVFNEQGKDIAAVSVLEGRVLSREVRAGPPLEMNSHLLKFLGDNDALPTEYGVRAIKERDCSYLLDCARSFFTRYELKLYEKEAAIISEDRAFRYLERETALNSFILDILRR